MNVAQQNMRAALERSIEHAFGAILLAELAAANPEKLERLKALAYLQNYNDLAGTVAAAVLRDWKVTERPRGERRVQP